MNQASSYAQLNREELEQARGHKDHLISLSQEFLKSTPLTHLWISRCYFDGRYIDLTTDLCWKEKCIDHELYKAFVTDFLQPLNPEHSQPVCLPWQTNCDSKISLLRELSEYQIISGFNLAFFFQDHIQTFGFASATNEVAEVCQNLPAREELEMFCLYLRERTLDQLQNPAFGNMNLTFSLNSNTKKPGYMSPLPQSFTLSCLNREAKLGRQQLICLALLAQGYSCKAIANMLQISRRTVESHLLQIKRKFDHPSTACLISEFKKSPLANINPLTLHATA